MKKLLLIVLVFLSLVISAHAHHFYGVYEAPIEGETYYIYFEYIPNMGDVIRLYDRWNNLIGYSNEINCLEFTIMGKDVVGPCKGNYFKLDKYGTYSYFGTLKLNSVPSFAILGKESYKFYINDTEIPILKYDNYQSTYELVQWDSRETDSFYCIDICDENWNIYDGFQA